MSITRGTWFYDEQLGEVFAVNDADGSHSQLAIVQDNDADGVLMALAPVMLAELKSATEKLRREGYIRDADALDALIAKAEGT